MEDAQIRKYFKMSPEMTGVLINEVYPLSGAHGILKKEDAILAIDGVSIGNNGTEEPVDFNYLFPLKKPGETVLVKVLRKGRQHEFNINLELVLSLCLFPNHSLMIRLICVNVQQTKRLECLVNRLLSYQSS